MDIQEKYENAKKILKTEQEQLRNKSLLLYEMYKNPENENEKISEDELFRGLTEIHSKISKLHDLEVMLWRLFMKKPGVDDFHNVVIDVAYTYIN